MQRQRNAGSSSPRTHESRFSGTAEHLQRNQSSSCRMIARTRNSVDDSQRVRHVRSYLNERYSNDLYQGIACPERSRRNFTCAGQPSLSAVWLLFIRSTWLNQRRKGAPESSPHTTHSRKIECE